MNKNVKPSNPMKVITGPDTRWSYANVWEPKSINGGAPKYSVSLIIPKSDTKTVAKIKAAIEAAYAEGEAKHHTHQQYGLLFHFVSFLFDISELRDFGIARFRYFDISRFRLIRFSD